MSGLAIIVILPTQKARLLTAQDRFDPTERREKASEAKAVWLWSSRFQGFNLYTR